MNIDKLKTFCTVVEYDSFSKASEKLFCSQPAISKQIRSLEKELQYPLFERDGKRISLNENGKIVYRYSQRILKDISEMKYALIEQNNTLNPLVSFGTTNFIGVHVITPQINKFKELFPDTPLTFTVDFTPGILKMLYHNKVSFAFISESNLLVNYPDIKTDFFKDDELVLVVPINHKWANKYSVTLDDLLSEEFLLSQPSSAVRNFIEKQLAVKGISLKNQANLYNIEGIKQSLLNGHGISILPKKSVTTELKYNLLKEIPIENFKLTRKLFIAYKENKKFNQNELNFINSLT
ncbi:CysJI operon transcriptional activator [uncultured Clostridium sp.]|uniref:LysR family transcriptional regulator n=1 Tax=uncultured Clostridium sp. TaxID=59620 RepID=UPI000821491F|nr:LysR family transcriptional regulator [uncultured Clostridium sp.]SCI98578.1 CysJI operon transcriptional activator [uncultured Clostridium sp.]